MQILSTGPRKIATGILCCWGIMRFPKCKLSGELSYWQELGVNSRNQLVRSSTHTLLVRGAKGASVPFAHFAKAFLLGNEEVICYQGT